MAKSKVLDARDLKIYFTNVKNLATGKVIPVEWQWLPEEFAVKVRFDRHWIFVRDDGRQCNNRAKACDLVCQYVKNLSEEKAKEVLSVQRDEF